jgi:hypothetical protein
MQCTSIRVQHCQEITHQRQMQADQTQDTGNVDEGNEQTWG